MTLLKGHSGEACHSDCLPSHRQNPEIDHSSTLPGENDATSNAFGRSKEMDGDEVSELKSECKGLLLFDDNLSLATSSEEPTKSQS